MAGAEPRNKAQMMDRITSRWDELQALLASLTPSQWGQPLGDGWSAKAHVAHLEAWERSLILLLSGGRRDSAMNVDSALWATEGGMDKVNAILARRAEARPLESVLQLSNDTHAEIVRILEGMSDDDLAKPYSHYQPDDPPNNANPVYGWVNGNTWGHYEEHIGWLRAGLATGT
jgi:hypothetical protein